MCRRKRVFRNISVRIKLKIGLFCRRFSLSCVFDQLSPRSFIIITISRVSVVKLFRSFPFQREMCHITRERVVFNNDYFAILLINKTTDLTVGEFYYHTIYYYASKIGKSLRCRRIENYCYTYLENDAKPIRKYKWKKKQQIKIRSVYTDNRVTSF